MEDGFLIRFARESDIEHIMDFIRKYWWRKEVLLGKDRDFFEYEHLFEEGVTYVISENDEGEIDAILGYIPYGRKHRDISTVMWRVSNTENLALGVKLLLFLRNNADVRILLSPGTKKRETEVICTYLGYYFGKMTHWYRLNKKEKYVIAKVENPIIPNNYVGKVEFEKLESWEQLERQFDFNKYYERNPKPLKESWYIKRRYFHHPVYKYEVFGIKEGLEIKTIFVFRQIFANGSSMLKFIDCIGDMEKISKAMPMIDQLLDKYGAEYVDCYETGIADCIFQKAGWIKTEGSGNIIPNYFEPFEQKNIEIYYITSDSEIVLFRGDGDQDRPN